MLPICATSYHTHRLCVVFDVLSSSAVIMPVAVGVGGGHEKRAHFVLFVLRKSTIGKRFDFGGSFCEG